MWSTNYLNHLFSRLTRHAYDFIIFCNGTNFFLLLWCFFIFIFSTAYTLLYGWWFDENKDENKDFIFFIFFRGNLTKAVELFNKAISLARTEIELSHLFSLQDAAIAQARVAAKFGISVPAAGMGQT